MDTSTLVLIESGLIFGAILLLAFRELWVLRRDRREDAARAGTEAADTAHVDTAAVDTPAVDASSADGPPVSGASAASGTAASPAPPGGRSA